VTVEPRAALDPPYDDLLSGCYDAAAADLAAILGAGTDVAVLCEGDPFFYGSYMHLHTRLADRFETTVVPGIPSMVAGAAAIARPLVSGNEVLSVFSGVLPEAELVGGLAGCSAAVIIKLGRNLDRVRGAVERAGLLGRAYYVERATSTAQRWCPLAEADAQDSPYFSMIVIPSAASATRR
jgi:precorrin-2/cobalt-factor-2 C20-methyltransferase